MIFLRSLLFNIAWLSWTALLCLLYVPLLLMSRDTMRRASGLWTLGILTLARWIVGLRYEVRGLEHLPPDGGCIVAAKHQSAWDTFLFHGVLPDPVYILKKELLAIPFIGWYMRKGGMIDVDRDAGASAMRHMIAGAKAAAAEGRQLVIFPEGTRTPPGDHRPYKPGIMALYGRMNRPVIPVALNSGWFWARQSFLKYPGTIVVEFLPPIAPGLDRHAFMDVLHTRIEAACERLNAEARTSRGLPPAAPPPAAEPSTEAVEKSVDKD